MPDRTIAPPFQTPAQTKLTRVESTTLSNGLPFHHLILGDQEVCRVEMVLRSGKWFEEKPGVSYFSSKMLLEGTARYSSKEISDRLDFYGAFYEITPGLDFVTLTLYCLSKYLPEVMPFFLEIAAMANFPEKELDTQKRIKTQQIRVNNQKTAALAAKGFRHLLFGQQHPYGHELVEDEVVNVTVDDLQAFHREAFFNKPEVIVAGKVAPRVLDGLAKLFGQFQYIVKDAPVRKAANSPFVREIIPLEGSVQASLRIGTITVNKRHPDHFPLTLLNEILGGYFGSRLMKNIREDKGYTYGIFSSISYLQQESFWTIGTDVKREVAVAAIEEIGREMRVLKEQEVPAAELETVKNYMAGTFLTSITSAFSLADKFKTIHFSGLGYDYYDQYIARIRETTSEELLRVANDFLKEEEWVQVVGGGV